MEQKHINVIRTCLKTMRAFGNEKSKMDIEETLKAFNEAVKAKTLNITFAGEMPKKSRVKSIEEQIEEWEKDQD